MQAIPKEQILRRLEFENPWWSAPHEIPDLFGRWQPRPYLNLLLPLVTERDIRRALVLMGPRRVGKTVLIHHVIHRLLAGGTPPERICYVSVDHPLYVGASLEQLLGLYGDAAGVDARNDECFVFFDEIQYLKDWEVHLKALVDSLPAVKAVASGSAAAALRLKSAESGAGRFTEFFLPPLSFHEYLALLGERELLEAGLEALDEGRVEPLDIEELNLAFVHYLNFGGYPEVVFSPKIQADPRRFVKSDIIDKVLQRDLPSLYGIEDIQELNALFTNLAFNSAQEVSLEGLSQNAKVSKPTLRRYIEYLEAAFLIQTLHRVDKRARRFQRTNQFKVYLTNPSMRAALFSPIDAENEAMGALVETGVLAQWFHSTEQLHYARWSRGEIDLVMTGPDRRARWAAEIKWSDRFARRPRLLREAIGFCLQNNLSSLLTTTRTQMKRETLTNVEIHLIPAALYSLALGYHLVTGRPAALELFS
jgi:predicted AAA+ superfamily ATPase